MGAPRLTDEQRENAMRLYLALGSYQKAGAAAGIAWQTIALWKHRDPVWWQDMIDKLNSEMEEKYRAGWREVLTNALDVMQDRLANGNHVLVRTKDGHRTARVPVQAKDAVVIAGIAADKLRLSMGLPNRITGSADDGGRMEELRKLGEAARAARKKTEKSETPTLQ